MSKVEAKINREMLMLKEENIPRIGESSNESHARKVLIVGTKSNIDLNAEQEDKEIVRAQDANNVGPKLWYELEVEIFARVSCLEYWKLQFLNKQFSHLLKSREIFRVRRESGFVKPYVFMLSGGETRWAMFDKNFKNVKKLPEVPSDDCFLHSDKETISVGTQIIVVGREVEGIVVWRYELEMHKWYRGPAMIKPRFMYGSASRGNDAFFAGGIHIDEEGNHEVVTTAEIYNAETKTWKMIREMHKRRRLCSGCFLHGKFYVIGGRDEDNENLSCGESYDEVTNSWKLIPDMLKDVRFRSLQSPPLIAVVNDNLYMIETSLNELRVYDINANAWKKLGNVPVRADSVRGWGVAFKSLGDRLLLIGGLSVGSFCGTMNVYTCRPSSNLEEHIWEKSNSSFDGVEFSHFVFNCCVMFA